MKQLTKIRAAQERAAEHATVVFKLQLASGDLCGACA